MSIYLSYDIGIHDGISYHSIGLYRKLDIVTVRLAAADEIKVKVVLFPNDRMAEADEEEQLE